jgi:hypothetical protein
MILMIDKAAVKHRAWRRRLFRQKADVGSRWHDGSQTSDVRKNDVPGCGRLTHPLEKK